MKPAPFDYYRPESLEEALAPLDALGPEAQLLAGGQSLAALLNMRLARPELVVDIGGLARLATLEREDDGVEVGAATTQARLESWTETARRLPLVAQALPHVGHPQTRARGTVCGSIAHGDPSSELPLCLVTLGGTVTLASLRARREVPAEAFFRGVLTTARQSDEMVLKVRFPAARRDTGYAFREVAPRHGDFAIVAVAAAVWADAIAIGVGGMADVPVRREWPRLAGGALDDALNALAWELGGHSDLHASARYRRELVRRIGRQTIEAAAP